MTVLLGRAAVFAVLAGCVAGIAACGHDDAVEPPNDLDLARGSTVRSDPALAGGVFEPATTETGSSNSSYRRAQVVRDGGAATPAQLVAAVRAAGWRVTSVTCRDAVQAASQPAVEVQAFRTMPEPTTGGGSYTVALRIEDRRVIAVVPYHLDAANPWGAPDTDVTPDQSCAETRGAPASAGRAVTVDVAAARSE